MKSHVWRPLYLAAGLLALFLIARYIYVPKDFGTGERGYRYSFHRIGNEDEWKAFKVKYKGTEYCKDCHSDKYQQIMKSRHAIIACENCHGPAIDHPENPTKLTKETNREHCLRCHFRLPYPTSGRSSIRGVDPEKHNPGAPCSACHNPHKPQEGLR